LQTEVLISAFKYFEKKQGIDSKGIQHYSEKQLALVQEQITPSILDD